MHCVYVYWPRACSETNGNSRKTQVTKEMLFKKKKIRFAADQSEIAILSSVFQKIFEGRISLKSPTYSLLGKLEGGIIRTNMVRLNPIKKNGKKIL